MKIVDTSRVQKNFRVTLVEAVREKLGNPEIGDIIGFYEDADGNVIIRKL
jgi:bifunctional DNA-binding transcriptional regulator/antitoxin component of YhaV-PrlF toxin-antitoxin module